MLFPYELNSSYVLKIKPMLYQFSCFQVNSVNKQLHIGGKPVESDERVTGLLIELAKSYPEHCSKPDLLNTLWPDTVVSDWSISKLVSEARNLFKQHGYESDVIQTLHGRGYRLVRELGDQIQLTDALPPYPSARESVPANKRKGLPYLSLALVIMLLVVLVSYFIYEAQDINVLKKSEPPHSIGRLLWVDDHPENNAAEKAYLEKQNITVYQVKSSEAALTSVALYEYNLIISDMGRGEEVLAGLNLLKSIRQNDNNTPFILYTIVLTQTQQDVLEKYQGQGVAVEPKKLYELVMPYFSSGAKKENTE